VFDGVLESLAGHEVGGRLHRGRQPVAGTSEFNRDRQPSRQSCHGCIEALFGEHCWVDAVRQIAKFFDRGLQFAFRLVYELCRRTAVREFLPGQLQGQPYAHQPLLGPVMQVTLKLTAGFVLGVHEPRPGCLDFFQARL
jgi:hypothetical protein